MLIIENMKDGTTKADIVYTADGKEVKPEKGKFRLAQYI